MTEKLAPGGLVKGPVPTMVGVDLKGEPVLETIVPLAAAVPAKPTPSPKPAKKRLTAKQKAAIEQRHTMVKGDGSYLIPAMSKEQYRDMAHAEAEATDQPLKNVFASMAKQFRVQHDADPSHGWDALADWAELDRHHI